MNFEISFGLDPIAVIGVAVALVLWKVIAHTVHKRNPDIFDQKD